MREGIADTASVQIYDLAVLTAWKSHAPAEGIPALFIDQTDFAELIERASKGGQMASQVSARSITDAQFLDAAGIFGAWQEFPISVPLNLPTLGTRLGIRMGTRSVSVIHAHACLVVSWWV